MNNNRLNQTFSFVKVLLAIVIAMLTAFVIILIVSDEPMEALHAFLLGPFTSTRRMGNLIENTVPLIYVGLGVCVLWATGKRTLSGEGCYYFGGLMAAAVSLKLTVVHGHSLTLVSMAVVLVVCGLMALLPMIVNLKYGTDAFVVSLLFNYVIFYIGNYIFSNYLMDITSTSSGSIRCPRTASSPRSLTGQR